MTTPAQQIKGRILIENARIIFSKGLFEAGRPKGISEGNPAYSYKLILPRDHPQVPALMKEINDAVVSLFKEQAPQMLAKAKADNKICLRDGNTAMDTQGNIYAGCAGNLVLSVRSDSMKFPRPPVLLGRTAVEQAQSKIFDGCYVNAMVNIFAYKTGSVGIGARQLATQYLRDGEPLGGGGGAPADLSAFPELADSAQAANEFGALFGSAAPAGVAGFSV